MCVLRTREAGGAVERLQPFIGHCRHVSILILNFFYFFPSFLQPVHSSKAVLCLVRLEFAGRSLGESSRIEVKEGEACAVFDFTALLEVPGVSQENVNEVICNPLLCR